VAVVEADEVAADEVDLVADAAADAAVDAAVVMAAEVVAAADAVTIAAAEAEAAVGVATNNPAAELCVIAVKPARIKIIEMERDVRLICGYRRVNTDVSWFMNIQELKGF
jgi:hypothetical protein